MTDKNYVTITHNCFYGYINEDTPCGRAKAKQVKADMETLATMLHDTKLSNETKTEIYIDYARAIREYVEREETCCGCTNECDCECECEEEEEEEEEEYEEEEEPTIEDIERYSICYASRSAMHCYSYSEAIEKIGLLLKLGIEPEVLGYDNQNKCYELDIIKEGERIYLKMYN